MGTIVEWIKDKLSFYSWDDTWPAESPGAPVYRSRGFELELFGWEIGLQKREWK